MPPFFVNSLFVFAGFWSGQGNAVPSTSVANVRIEQRGRGAAADAHAVGWLSRFFLNIAPS